MVISAPAHPACLCEDACGGIIDFRMGKPTEIFMVPTSNQHLAVFE